LPAPAKPPEDLYELPLCEFFHKFANGNLGNTFLNDLLLTSPRPF
jgi:hypothetical protein